MRTLRCSMRNSLLLPPPRCWIPPRPRSRAAPCRTPPHHPALRRPARAPPRWPPPFHSPPIALPALPNPSPPRAATLAPLHAGPLRSAPPHAGPLCAMPAGGALPRAAPPERGVCRGARSRSLGPGQWRGCTGGKVRMGRGEFCL